MFSLLISLRIFFWFLSFFICFFLYLFIYLSIYSFIYSFIYTFIVCLFVFIISFVFRVLEFFIALMPLQITHVTISDLFFSNNFCLPQREYRCKLNPKLITQISASNHGFSSDNEMIIFLRILSDILSFYFMIRFCSSHLHRNENENEKQNHYHYQNHNHNHDQDQISRKYQGNKYDNNNRNVNQIKNMRMNDNYDHNHDFSYSDKNFHTNLEKKEKRDLNEEEYGDLDESADLFFNEERSSAEVTSSCSFQFLPYSINYDNIAVLSVCSKEKENKNKTNDEDEDEDEDRDDER